MSGSRYNDGPESGQLSNGMCPGLDFFSIDNYRDDPAAEVGGVKAAYAPLLPKLRKPNPLEPKGQGLWVVPGIFWSMAGCTDAGGAGKAGTDSGQSQCPSQSWCANGTQCFTSPQWLVEKMELYWAWAQAEPAIRGVNVWHWQDVPALAPPSFSRGAVSLGPELQQWFRWIGHNVTARNVSASRPTLKLDDADGAVHARSYRGGGSKFTWARSRATALPSRTSGSTHRCSRRCAAATTARPHS